MYVFLREAYGPLLSFLFGWTLFLVIDSGAIATLTVAFASSYLPYFVKMTPLAIKVVSVAFIVFLATVNIIGVRAGANLQNVLTVIKFGALVVVAASSSSSPRTQRFELGPPCPGPPLAGPAGELRHRRWSPRSGPTRAGNRPTYSAGRGQAAGAEPPARHPHRHPVTCVVIYSHHQPGLPLRLAGRAGSPSRTGSRATS